MSQLSHLINSLLTKTKNSQYLEIGVMAGVTFHQVTESSLKVAVDPKFLFDVSHLMSANVRYETMTSDMYFLQNKQIFDVIFIDGLHEFKQSLKDLLSSLAILSHETAYVIIDDIWPTDIFSSLPDQQECYDLRREFLRSNEVPLDWRGDVYKILFFTKSFLGTWKASVVTETADTNHRLILTRYGRNNLALPESMTLEQIERLSYTDFRKYSKYINTLTIDDYLALEDKIS
jgi:hypothetical protein